MQNGSEQSTVLPTYAEAMRAQSNLDHRSINDYYALASPNPTIGPYISPGMPNYSQPLSTPPYQPYEQYNAPANTVPPTIHVIRHVSTPPRQERNGKPIKSLNQFYIIFSFGYFFFFFLFLGHRGLIFGFILGLIILAAILRATIHSHGY